MRWLFDVVSIVACILWQRRKRADVRPELRLVTGSVAPARDRRRRGRVNGVITVLAANRDMEARLLAALSPRAVVRTTTTWAELEQVISGTRPLAVFADPLADETGDPEGHLTRFSHHWAMPVVLYTTLSPACASRLLHLGGVGIRHVVFTRFDDGAERLNAIVDSLQPHRGWPPPPPPLFAA